MRERILIGSGLLAFLVFAFLLTPVLYAEDAPGKQLFMDNKCNTCHSIESQTIKKTLASSKAPDLSNVGSEQKVEWMVQFLQKKVDKNGKKHMKLWTGKEEDLKTLTEWLATLKKAETK